ncbi:MAG: efflux RND transporter periplasmic adaptor subunit [Fuerstiella sp.]|nr:efflux RND transporter periplasmic adaptor subunit [Fuerstiella sp.]
MKYANRWAWPVSLTAAITVCVLAHSVWFPSTRSGVRRIITKFRAVPANAASDSHVKPTVTDSGGHDHETHAGHTESTSAKLSAESLKNMGLTKDTVLPVRLQSFRTSITVPAVVVEQPGRTRVQVATPMTGAITHIHAVEGEAVQPGTLLFRIQLTHEDLVKAQTNFVKTVGDLQIEENEIARLQKIPNSGAVAGRLLLERKYAKEKLTALLTAQRESLRLHGLSDSQVSQISKTRRLLGDLHMFAPSSDDHSDDEIRLTEQPLRPVAFEVDHAQHHKSATGEQNTGEQNTVPAPLILQKLNVQKGQSVGAGETLCVLTDLRHLYIEGVAFESDVHVLRQALQRGWKVSAVFNRQDESSGRIDELQIAWLANEISSARRTLHFYIVLPNNILHQRQQGGRRYVDWMYFAGQRLQIHVPVEEWPDRIVLPVDAVAQEGAEYFVFQKKGNDFHRVSVHVEYHDQHSFVIAGDATLRPGDLVAMKGAHQMQMALKNKAPGNPDPHAGHSH